MKRLRLLWYLYPAFLVLTLAAVLAVTLYVTNTLHDFHITQIEKSLTARATLVSHQISGKLYEANSGELDALSKKLGQQTETRITIILPNGVVLADSKEDPSRMDNHARRPEIAAALKGGKGVSTRYSRTLLQNQMYVALPVMHKERITGCIRTAIPVTEIDAALASAYGKIAGTGFLVALVLAILSLLIARRISRPLEQMRLGAERFALGELDRRLPTTGAEEISALADSLNNMAGQLDERFQTVIRQRNELEAVLTSMVEGVLAVDNNEQIIRINKAAAELFETDMAQAVGRPVQEVLRKAELQQFISDSLQARHPIERDLVLLSGNSEIQLQAHGSPLLNAQDSKIGALVVVNDVTRLRRLENLRRDFVANVSHELKTPITAIKGWAETLREGEDDLTDDQQRPIEIIARQADRLNAIINDLLDLSRIEQEQEHADIELQQTAIRPVIDASIQACSVDAKQKDIKIDINCSDALVAPINPPLLEQALIN
ncbi:MAG: cell wall metabolism sensor histidine kinase WalK, partial [Desulfuromonadales bacterium]|nr:cell wall metabolism sensor histidine kinase WalK [Desulfuromonadales bacterium]NIS40745.1 cell wall metabolism sensor histidine kinase WalK [Desulfuromonadales bacterium]